MSIGSTVTVTISANAARAAAAFSQMRAHLRRTAADARVAANRMRNSFIQRGGIPGVLGPHLNRASRMIRAFATTAAGAVRTGFQNISNVIQGGFSALPPQAKAIVAGAGIALGLALAAYIGATLNAALLGAIGGGVLAIGIKKAMQDSRVKDAFGFVSKFIGDDLADASKVFVYPLEKAAARIRNVWREAIGPGLREAFEDLAPVIDKLAFGVSKFFRNIMPGFNKAVKAAGPILSAVAGQLGDLGTSFSKALESMARGEDGAIKGAITTFKVLGVVIEHVGHILGGAAIAYDGLTKAAEKLGNIPGLGGLVSVGLAKWLTDVNDAAEEGFAEYLPDYAEGLLLAAEASQEAARAAQKLEDKMRGMFDTMTGSTDAALRYEEAIDALAESVRENGNATDIGTDKGRNNIQAVEEIARAAWAARDAAIALAGGQNASAAAVEAANAKFDAQVDALGFMLRSLGFTEQQIDDLLRKWEELSQANDITKNVTVNHTTVFRETGGPRYNPAPGQHVGYAAGGHPRGLALVGERGPELVDFGHSGRVYNNGQSRRMLQDAAGGGGRGAAGVEIHVHAGSGTMGSAAATFTKEAFRSGHLRLEVRKDGKVVEAR